MYYKPTLHYHILKQGEVLKLTTGILLVTVLILLLLNVDFAFHY